MRKVHNFAPATEDWFLVAHLETKRWCIERVVAWALFQADENTTNVLSGFIGQGYVPDHEDCFYVKGTDKSPTGRRWGEIYDDIMPGARNSREINDSELLAKLNRG